MIGCWFTQRSLHGGRTVDRLLIAGREGHRYQSVRGTDAAIGEVAVLAEEMTAESVGES